MRIAYNLPIDLYDVSDGVSIFPLVVFEYQHAVLASIPNLKISGWAKNHHEEALNKLADYLSDKRSVQDVHPCVVGTELGYYLSEPQKLDTALLLLGKITNKQPEKKFHLFVIESVFRKEPSKFVTNLSDNTTVWSVSQDEEPDNHHWTASVFS